MKILYRIIRVPYHIFKKSRKRFNLILHKHILKNTIDSGLLKKRLLDIGLKKGMNVYVHSSLSSFGYIEGGPNTVLEVLDDIVNDGTIIMPTFTHFKKEFNLNDVCWTGKIAETFRLQNNTHRSVHPTHSVAARGKDANYLIKDHEKSERPFDENSPFYKLTRLDSYILMLGTENNSMIHYVQDKVKFPNLFLKGVHNYKFKNKILKTKLHHPLGSITYICKGKQCTDVDFLIKFYKDEKFEEKDIMKTLKIGKAVCHLIKTKEFVNISTKYLGDNIKKYKEEYKSILRDGKNESS